jgi:hypothetical protein
MPVPSGTVGSLDARRVSNDAGELDHVVADHAFAQDVVINDRSPYSEDAGVSYHNALACLSGMVSTQSCYADARSRALPLHSGAVFSRAIATVDSTGYVDELHAGLVYLFCKADAALFDCLSVEYYWTGATAQVALSWRHNEAGAFLRQRELLAQPNSPEVMSAFLASQDCDLGDSGVAQLSFEGSPQGDRIKVFASQDSLTLSDPALEQVEHHCLP